MSNFNVQNKNWRDIAFEGRNKSYGAYQLRKDSDVTTIKAMLITFGTIALGIGLFSFATPTPKPIVASKPIELPPIVRVVKLKPIEKTEPKTIIKKGTDKPKLNLTPNKVPPTVVNKPEVKPVIIPKNPDTSTPFNPNGTENGKPGPEGKPEGKITPIPNTGSASGTDKNPYKGVLGVEASFPGGINKFRSFIAENYKIPNSFNKDVLFIELVFVIELDGSMTDIRMVSKGDKALENEAIRVLKAMNKKWTPGKVNGIAVRSEKRLPIQIIINETEE